MADVFCQWKCSPISISRRSMGPVQSGRFIVQRSANSDYPSNAAEVVLKFRDWVGHSCGVDGALKGHYTDHPESVPDVSPHLLNSSPEP